MEQSSEVYKKYNNGGPKNSPVEVKVYRHNIFKVESSA